MLKRGGDDTSTTSSPKRIKIADETLNKLSRSDKSRRAAPEAIRRFLHKHGTDEREAECVVLSRRRKIYVAEVGKIVDESCFMKGREGKFWLIPDGFVCGFVCKNKSWAGFINYRKDEKGHFTGPWYVVREIDENGIPLENPGGENVLHQTAHSAFKQVLEAANLGNPNNTNARLFFGVHNENGQLYIRDYLLRNNNLDIKSLDGEIQNRLKTWTEQYHDQSKENSMNQKVTQLDHMWQNVKKGVLEIVETDLKSWETNIREAETMDIAALHISNLIQQYQALTGREMGSGTEWKINHQNLEKKQDAENLGTPPPPQLEDGPPSGSSSPLSAPEENHGNENLVNDNRIARRDEVSQVFGTDQESESVCRSLFDSIRTDASNCIEEKTWVKYLVDNYGQPEDVAKTFFQQVSRGTPEVTFLDFAIFWKKKEEVLYSRFRKIDQDNNDSLELSELRKANKEQRIWDTILSEEHVNTINDHLDALHDKDGRVSWKEFRDGFIMVPIFSECSRDGLTHFARMLATKAAQTGPRALPPSGRWPTVFLSFTEWDHVVYELLYHLPSRYGPTNVLHAGDSCPRPLQQRFQEHLVAGAPCVWIAAVPSAKPAAPRPSPEEHRGTEPCTVGEDMGMAAAHTLTLLAESPRTPPYTGILPERMLPDLLCAIQTGCPVITVYSTGFGANRDIQKDLEALPGDLNQLALQPKMPISDEAFHHDILRICQQVEVQAAQYMERRKVAAVSSS